MMNQNDREVLEESIRHWRELAATQRARGDVVATRRADTYERTAQALEKELATGVSHCVDHLSPRDSCGRCAAVRKG